MTPTRTVELSKQLISVVETTINANPDIPPEAKEMIPVAVRLVCGLLINVARLSHAGTFQAAGDLPEDPE